MKEFDLSKIPYGDYCYTIENIKKDKKFGVIITTKMCPYYERLNDGRTGCKFLGIYSDEDLLISDQVKICHINEIYNNI
jgi:hypothetical protein